MLGIASVRDAEETPAQDEDAEDAPLSGMSRTMRSSSKAATAAMIASAMAEEEDQVRAFNYWAYSGNLKSGLVWISNGLKELVCKWSGF